MTVLYSIPEHWVKYDLYSILNELTDAKAAIMSLTAIPYQRTWADSLQEMELKREVAGTSKIEGADFTEKELTMIIVAIRHNLTVSFLNQIFIDWTISRQFSYPRHQ